MSRRVAGEEDAVLGRVPQLVGDPVALVADRIAVQVARQPDGRLLDADAGVERADADPDLVVGGEAPAVAGGHVAAIDPDLQVVGGSARVHLEPARERRLNGLVAAGAEHAAPAQAVDDQRRPQLAPIGLDPTASPEAAGPLTCCGLELGVAAARTGARTGPGSRRSRTSTGGACGW